MKKITLIAALIFLTGVKAFGQGVDAQVYAQLKAYMVMTNHQDDEGLKARIDAITNNPVPYLKALADDTSLRIYAKQRAISALKYYQSNEAEAFLGAKVQDSLLHPSLRNFAVKSYAEGFYHRNPAKAESLLGPFENDRKIGATVHRSLQDARAKTPPDTKKHQKKDFNFKNGGK